MKVGHDDEADDGDDNADEFDAFVRSGAGGPGVGDFLVENRDGGADGQDKDANK